MPERPIKNPPAEVGFPLAIDFRDLTSDTVQDTAEKHFSALGEAATEYSKLAFIERAVPSIHGEFASTTKFTKENNSTREEVIEKGNTKLKQTEDNASNWLSEFRRNWHGEGLQMSRTTVDNFKTSEQALRDASITLDSRLKKSKTKFERSKERETVVDLISVRIPRGEGQTAFKPDELRVYLHERGLRFATVIEALAFIEQHDPDLKIMGKTQIIEECPLDRGFSGEKEKAYYQVYSAGGERRLDDNWTYEGGLNTPYYNDRVLIARDVEAPKNDKVPDETM